MRPARILITLLGLLTAGGLAASWSLGRLSAQEAPASLLVSGLEIGGPNKALLRFRNVSPAGGDTYLLTVTVRTRDGGDRVSQTDGIQLRTRDTIELDISSLVAAYREQFGAPPDFSGPVQVNVTGFGGLTHPFGPGTVYVKAVQRRGRVIYEAATRWQ